MKKQIFLLLTLIFCFVTMMIPVSAQSEIPLNWYCIRNKDHKQPRVDTELQFVDKYDGYYVDRRHGDNCEKKMIYLTFDAGYENGNIEKILDVMKSENVKGAFFVLGNLIEKNPMLIKRMVDEGHIVCNHTYTHKDMTKLSEEEFATELDRLNTSFTKCTGQEMARYYRPPEGKFSEKSLKWAQKLGYKTIFWSFAYADWDNDKQMDPHSAKEKILSNIHNGAVLLLHPTSKTNALILEDVIRELKAQNYEFGTLDELVKTS